jgi:peroxiredoxin
MTDRSAVPLPGQPAPDFTLPVSPERQMSLAETRGRPTVLAFYPADWSPVCTDQMSLYEATMPEFDRYDAAVLGISVDGVWCHRAFALNRGITFPLLSDFEPKGAVARQYGVYAEGGRATRSLFLVDPDGIITWSLVSAAAVNPGADGILDALEELDITRQVSMGVR